MYNLLVKDLMIPVNRYPTINANGTMFDALIAIKMANQSKDENQENYQAALVTDDEGKIVGKIGRTGFLKALEPKYNNIFDMDKLSRMSLSSNYVESLMSQFNLWESFSPNLCKVAAQIKVSEIMSPIEQHIDMNDTIFDAIHKLIMWQTLSILVIKDNEIVGIIRLSDIYNSIENYIIQNCDNCEE